MRIVFMGTPEFAVPILQAAAEAHEVVAVYTRPDRRRGRGAALVPSPVKEAALRLGVPVAQPPTLRTDDAAAELAAYGCDVVVVAAYGAILPAAILDVPPMGCINVHASLLPRWRGAAPVQRAILAGDQVTGVSVMRMEEGLDTGPYADVETVAVADLDTEGLTARLAEAGAVALLRTLDRIAAGSVTWTPQDPAGVTWADKITAADVAIDPSCDVETALRRIRASSRSAPCRVDVAGRRLTVLAARRAATPVAAGEVAVAGAPALGVADGAIELVRVVPEGRAPMDATAYARGARLPEHAGWSAL